MAVGSKKKDGRVKEQLCLFRVHEGDFFSFSQNYKQRAESDSREQSRDNMFRQHFIKKTGQERRNFQEGRESGVR